MKPHEESASIEFRWLHAIDPTPLAQLYICYGFTGAAKDYKRRCSDLYSAAVCRVDGQPSGLGTCAHGIDGPNQAQHFKKLLDATISA